MIIDKLLQADREQVAGINRGEIEIKRLSQILGEPFVMKLKSIPTKKLREIMNKYSITAKTAEQLNEKEAADAYALGLEMIVEASAEPDFTDARLLTKYETDNPMDVVEEIFLPGELLELANKIQELMGNTSQAKIDEEIKN